MNHFNETTVRCVYIRAEKEVTLRHIEPGSYVLAFSLGSDWDDETGRFRTLVSSREADRDRLLSGRARLLTDRTFKNTLSHFIPCQEEI